MNPARGRAGSCPDARVHADACVEAFRREFDFVHRCVRRYGARPADVDDLVQEVFIAMWRRWPDFDDTRPLRPWLAGIAFRVVRCSVRRRRPEPIHLPEGLDEGGGLPGARLLELHSSRDEDQAARDARALVMAVLDCLPEQHRGPLVMHELDELTPQEMAALLNTPVATIYTRIRRARLAFAKIVNQLQERGRADARLAIAPLQLLAVERQPPAAPAAARFRAEAFARAVVQLPALPPDPLAGEKLLLSTGRGSGFGLRAGLLAGLAIGVAATLAVVTGLRSATVSDPIAQPTAEPARPVAPARRIAPLAVRSLPAFRVPIGVPDVRPADLRRSLGQGLTGYWSFDDGPGAGTVRDHSGAGRNCQLSAPPAAGAWVPGVFGRALSLEAVTWLTCAQPEVQREQPLGLTVAAWVQRRSKRAPAAIVTRQIGQAYEDQFFFGFNRESLRVVSHAWSGWVSAPAPPPSARWHHVAFTRGRDGVTRLYLDGAEVGHNQGPTLGAGAITAPFTIGAGRYSSFPQQVRQRLDGAVDEVLAYERALSPQEIQALAAGERPAMDPQPGR